MKNDQSITTLSDSLLYSNLNYNQPQILCSANKPSYLICTDLNCNKQAFVCQNQSCSCQLQHQKCFIMKIKSVHNNLTSKLISTQLFQNQINQNIDKIIDQLSNFRDKLIIDFRQNLNYHGLTQNQKQLLISLNEGKKSKITGNKVWQVVNNFYNKQNKQQKQMTQLFNQIKKSFQSYLLATQSLIKSIQTKLKSNILFNNKKVVNNNIKNSDNLFSKSNIINLHEQINTIQQFFGLNKIIKKTELLYKASQNQFSAKKFHQKCDNITNTITLCQTQFNKKIGGFNSLSWQSLFEKKWKTDQKGESFLFSISQKDKFILQQKTKAIYYNANYGPVFGGGSGLGASGLADFAILNNSNSNTDSFANINTAYNNIKYIKNDLLSFERFSGNKDSKNFKIKEWEVWRIQFQ